jgi:type II secretory pathway pseudopilin PulG
MLSQITLIVILAVLAIIGVVLPVVTPKLTAWLKSKTKNEKAANIMERLINFVANVVLELDQTIVDKLKKDGKWNAEEAAKVKAMAVEKINSYLGPAGVAEALAILGIDNPTLQALISTLIEACVRKNKLAAAKA